MCNMPGSKEWDFMVVGELFFDEILSGLQAFPKLGEEAFARKYCREVGGGAAITACGLAKLGAKVAVLGVIGHDGDWLTSRLGEFGVDTNLIERDRGGPTGLTVSVSTREDRAFFSYYGANDALNSLLRRHDWIEHMSSAKVVHIATSPDGELDANLIPVLKRAKVMVSLDVQSHMSWLTSPSTLKILRAADIFFPNELEAEWVSGQSGVHRILRGLRAKGLKRVAVKLGGKGAALTWDRRELFVDPYSVDTEDTTGAGDCFNAGFLFAYLRGEKEESCLQWANICGALSTRELGGVRGFPTLRELQEALEEDGR
jgi:sugar/nucleoside kinase (ribokinase family)